jgi:Arm DNA-binding domain
MGTLTVRALEAARPKASPYKLTVDRGLYLRVDPTGGKTWLVRYSVGGRQRQMRLPKPYGVGDGCCTLAEARTENARVQAVARSGTDPQQAAADRKSAEVALAELRRIELLTIGDLFNAWLADGVRRGDGNAELRRAFAKDVLPTLGAKTVRATTEHDLRSVLRGVVTRGVDRMAVRVFRDLRQLRMDRAIADGECNPGLERDAALEMLYSPIYARMLFGRGVPSAAEVDAFLAIAFRGIFRAD